MNKHRTSSTFSSAVEKPAAVQREHIWPRVWRTTVMTLMYLVVEIAIKAVAISQLAFVISRGAPAPWLRRRGEELAGHINAMWLYLSCAAREAPWPFSPWPRVSDERRVAPVRDGGGPRAPSRRPNRVERTFVLRSNLT